MQLITQRLENVHAFEKCLEFVSLNASEMQKLQTCVCFTHPLHKMWKWLSGPALAGAGPNANLGAGPLWVVVLWRRGVQSTVLYDHGRAHV